MFARLALIGAATVSFAASAAAHPHSGHAEPGVMDAEGHVYDGSGPDYRPEWRGPPPQPGAHSYPPEWEQQRASWLTECRRRHGSGNKVGGAVVGAVVGGVIGNRVAGRGNRTLGTVAGATVGAVAGGAIGDAADKRAARDFCEDYLERNMTWGQGYYPSYGQPVVGYGYAPMTVMMPVAYVPTHAATQPRECKETIVTTDYVTTTTPARYRTIRTYKRVPDKRVRIVPDKRVRTD